MEKSALGMAGHDGRKRPIRSRRPKCPRRRPLTAMPTPYDQMTREQHDGYRIGGILQRPRRPVEPTRTQSCG